MFSQSSLRQWRQLGLASLLALVGAITGANRYAKAQIVPDSTLPTNSIITPSGNTNIIERGTSAGSNLFHSFKQFNIDAGQQVFFRNPNGIENIISRVTGGSRSEILGTLGVLGSANLFLVNPNGIIFGPNARIFTGGSFVATTANAIGFGEQGFFSASSPNFSSLLTVNPSALLFNQIASQPITNQSLGLQLNPNRSLLLVGGDVNLEGGQLGTLNGRIELGGLAGAGTVGINVDGNNLSLSFPQNVQLADVSLTNATPRGDVSPQGRGETQVQGRETSGGREMSGFAGAETLGVNNVDDNNPSRSSPPNVRPADVSLTNAAPRGDVISPQSSGDILVHGRRITLTNGSMIVADNLGAGPGGSLTVNASELVEVTGGSRLSAEARGVGDAGNLTIETGNLIIRDGAQIAAGTLNEGKGGTVTVRASNTVELSGTSADGKNFSSILTQSDGAGDAGLLRIETGQLIVQGGARVSTATTGPGQGGTLIVNATDSVQLIGSSTSADNPEFSGLFALAFGSGKPGDLTIETRQLIVRDGARVTAANSGSAQSGGRLIVNATDSVQLIGTSPDSQVRSGLLVGTTGIGSAGELTIKTQNLQVLDGAFVSARTLGEGPGGRIMVTASDSVELIGSSADGQMPSLLTTETTGVRDAGNLTIETGQLTIKDNAQITSSSTGLGSAGNVLVEAGSIRLDQGSITSQTTSGNGGDITLSVKDFLLLRRGSEISTNAGTEGRPGNGGNITINTPSGFIFTVTQENSDITANAFKGRGGNVNINAFGIFGIQRRERDTPFSDITASSQFGLNGNVTINTSIVDFELGLVELPINLVDASRLIASSCAAFANKQSSSFINTGRGGLPLSPFDYLSSDIVWSDTRTTTIGQQHNSFETPPAKPPLKSQAVAIVPATGWVFNDKGEVTLISSVSNATGLGSNPASCPTQQKER